MEEEVCSLDLAIMANIYLAILVFLVDAKQICLQLVISSHLICLAGNYQIAQMCTRLNQYLHVAVGTLVFYIYIPLQSCSEHCNCNVINACSKLHCLKLV